MSTNLYRQFLEQQKRTRDIPGLRGSDERRGWAVGSFFPTDQGNEGVSGPIGNS